jgi:two-component system response regulator
MKKWMLLIEDNPDDEELTLDALRTAGVRNEVVVVRDGAEALAFLFGENRRLPQLILLDLKLPKVPGLEVLRQIRKDPETRYIPTVVLTSSSEGSDIRGSIELGANSYVRKPVDFADFAKAVQSVGVYWIQVNEDVRNHL